MKYTKHKLECLQNNIDSVIGNCTKSLAEIVEVYETGKFIRSELVNDLQMRFCFDLFYAIPQVNRDILDVYSDDCNDTHLFTALKACLPKIKRKY